MKRQTNVRLSEASREKLEQLAVKYGTQTSALEVAIHNLWTEVADCSVRSPAKVKGIA